MRPAVGMEEDEPFLAQVVSVLCHESQPSCLRNSLEKFENEQRWGRDVCQRLLSALASCLVQPGGAEAIARSCPQLVLPLLALARSRREWQERGSIALSNITHLHPDAERFALQHLEGPRAPFDLAPEFPQPKRRRGGESPSQLELLRASLALLRTNRPHYARLWHWSPLIDLLNSNDTDIRWAASECLALALGMSEKARTLLEAQISLRASTRREITVRECCPVSITTQSNQLEIDTESCDGMEEVCAMCPNVACVAGIALPAIKKPAQVEGLVMVASTHANLRSLAVAAAAGRPVLLQGPVGCGKTALVEHLAALTGRAGPPTLLKVQLGDETDSKMLLGAYRCSDVPGEFVWQPGVLTQAVQQGAWLLLEDMDCAGMDVVSVLASLIETRTLSVPGYRDCVKAAASFQLFATQRLTLGSAGLQRPHASPSAMLDKLWLQLSVEPLARHELQTVIETKFPVLAPVASRLLDVFLLFSRGSHAAALESQPSTGPISGMADTQMAAPSLAGRLVSTRDLLKWCARAVKGFDQSSPECALQVFQDAVDIFCCSAPLPEEHVRLAVAVAGRLGIVSTKAEFFCHQHKPEVRVSPTHVTAGRASVPRITEGPAFVETGVVVFSLTRAASCLLERVASCVANSEPVLLVGETGAGKTATVQLLARRAGRQLRVLNMNQHSDSADLLGGFKPVDMKLVIGPVREEFERLFGISFNLSQNAKFLDHIANCFSARRWDALLVLLRHSLSAALRKTLPEDTMKAWQTLADRMERLETQLKAGHSSLAFSFIEGALVRAVAAGEWVLLDEINLASAETLQCLSGLLEGSTGSLHLLERGDEKPIKRHPEFRLFACMNPATDVGKKDLPPGLRNRFTELYVEELTERSDLIQLSGCYLAGLGVSAAKLDILVKLYLQLRSEASKTLASGTGHKPHYSLRTLCRALAVAATNPCGGVSRSLLEAFRLSFLTQLDRVSQETVEQLIIKAVCGKEARSVVGQPLPEPSSGQHVNIEGFWVQQGDEEINTPENYILTKSVRGHLRDLARAVSLGRAPVLLQGETSVGKTSLVSYLARATGHRCLRINNHEHTDLQEYLGQYCAGQDGQLTFKEGALVEAMRKGHWVILDELNLAPSDVLEALNRVLDDNRELFIPETQTLVRAHPRFMLFATQNPPGLYGGRKLLSRAFRNRFVELHFGEIPSSELETILHQRCALPASYSKKMVAVMGDLQMRRRGSAAFAGKQGFMTLRDLFRWGERYRLACIANESKHNWEQHLADEGYLVLAGRVRREEEALVIQKAMQKHLKCELTPERLFSLGPDTSAATRTILEEVTSAKVKGFEHIVWTFNMRRLAVLLGKAIQFSEPALLVGETGCGKTSVCQLLAALRGRDLLSVNCHMHTEAADFLGSLRPVRDHQDEDRLFEWMDGPLVMAMTKGDWFLADEISLADDSVLERLNSLLEPERSLLLAEKGGECNVTANPGFQFVATMNPGGDFGKKELSPALRNRLTEVWCEGCEGRADRVAVVERSLRTGLALGNQQDGTSGVGRCSADFVEWLRATELGSRLTVSVRDLLTWVHFINAVTEGVTQESKNQHTSLDLGSAYMHGACLTFLDSLGSGPTSGASGSTVATARKAAMVFLEEQVHAQAGAPLHHSPLTEAKSRVLATKQAFGMAPFFIEKGAEVPEGATGDFLFEAPSTCVSVLRLLRALQLSKPVLLEGSPGVGKTSLVHALAKAAGHSLTRINLSDQTDAADLFGADLPVEGGVGGQFAWRDGPFLQALKAGHWIVLDELNLASQSVLEALNACLDHRGEVYVPELGRAFKVHARTTRLFACQNPQRQGGARRGLPRSFLNRFTQVFIEALTPADLEFIACSSFPDLPASLLSRMVAFTGRVARETGELRAWGAQGGPWEMNLRDLARWASAAKLSEHCRLGPAAAANLVYLQRMRTAKDRLKMAQVYSEEVGSDFPLPHGLPRLSLTPEYLRVGDVCLARGEYCGAEGEHLLLLRSSLTTLHALAACAHHAWLTILVGGPGSGKSSSVALLAALAGRTLRVLPVNSAMDTTEILGGFEQTDLSRHLDELSGHAETLVLSAATEALTARRDEVARQILQAWEEYRDVANEDGGSHTLAGETRQFQRRASLLQAALATLVPRPRAAQLIEALQDIAAKADAAGALNAGGRFEWVDSLLVKCLREGSWLLVENVNLCSAAVLDRLNALLEPGGQLVLGERGAGPDGTLHTVTPHPDFRLFFTMDPRNGDISRAMRNRGVEIYVAGPEEEGGAVPTLDLRALLAGAGVRHHGEQSALIAVHHALRSITSGSENLPGLSSLLRAAFLVRQNSVRGAGPGRALQLACLDVYVKPRASAEAKRQALTTLEEVMAAAKLGPSLQDLLPSAATPQVVSLQEDSGLAILQQQGALLSSAVAALIQSDEPSSNFLNQLCDITACDVPLGSLLPSLLLALYLPASAADSPLRHAWLLAQTGGVSDLQLVNKLSEDLSKAVTEFCADVDKPWDPRWLGEEGLADVSLASRLSLWLENLVLTAQEPDPVPVKKGRKEISALQYSMELAERRVSESVTSAPVITQLSRLLRLLEETLHATLANTKLTPAQCETLRRGLSWRAHMRNHAASTLITPLSAPHVASSLGVHFHWLCKKFITPLLEAAQQQDATQALELSVLATKLEAASAGEVLVLARLARKALPALGQPLPYPTQQQNDARLILDRVTALLQLWPCRERAQWRRLVSWLSSVQGAEARHSLAASLAQLNLRQEVSQDSLTQLEQLASCLEKSKGPAHRCGGGEWLVRERLCLTMSARVRFLALQRDEGLTRLLDQLVAMLNLTPSAPPQVEAAARALKQHLSNGSGTVAGIQLLVSNLLGWQTRHSPATHSPALWLDWSSPSSEQQEKQDSLTRELHAEQTGLNIRVGLHCPLLALVVTTETLGGSETIGEAEEHRKRLDGLSHLVWCATQALASPQYNFQLNEMGSVKSAFSQFLAAVHPNSNCGESFSTRVLLWKDSPWPLSSLSGPATKLAGLLDGLGEEGDLGATGRAWALLGYLNLSLAAALPTLDPVQRRALKMEYTCLDLEEAERTLYVHELLSRVSGETSRERPEPERLHPLISALREQCEQLREQRDKLATTLAVRPEPTTYPTLRKVVRQYAESVASSETVLGLCERLWVALRAAVPGTKQTELLLKQEANWQASQHKVCEGLATNGALYPDLAQPVLTAANQLSHGMALLSCAVRQQADQSKRSTEAGALLGRACRLPAIGPDQPSPLSLAATWTNMAGLAGPLLPAVEASTLAYRLQLSAIEELRNHVLARGQLDTDCVSELSLLFRRLTEAWKHQEEERQLREREEKSMFRVKAPKELEAEEMREIFPSFHQDFADVLPESSMTLDMEVSVIDESPTCLTAALISPDDLGWMGQLHADVFRGFTCCSWLAPQHSTLTARVAGPITQRLNALKVLLPHLLPSLDTKMDQELTGSYLLLLRHGSADPEPSSKPHDFYRDPLPEETVRCRPLLVQVQRRVSELLAEWPEHPTLINLDAVCTRLLGFSARSPVARLLCGLELLLSQLQAWESHAHAGVSVGALSQSVSHLVLEWRRLELQRWQDALDAVQHRFEVRALGKWWYHLCSMLLEESSKVGPLISAVQQFMEQASLGDFLSRLNLLHAFHCHALHLPPSPQHDDLQRILWNTHTFYSQFSNSVMTRLRGLRAPIEKKLREAVKIARWTDTNYWALRINVEKTHRTLHKHMKEFQGILAEPATSAMTVTPPGCIEWSPVFEPSNFLSQLKPVGEGAGGETVSQAARWFRKARRLSRELLLSASYPRLVQALVHLAVGVADTSKLVQTQEVPAPSSDKKKKKGQLKHLLQCKRKAVADFFRSLARLGLSYRAGMVKKRDPTREAFLAAPLDLEASLRTVQPSAADGALLASWQGCDSLMSVCLARLAQLRVALEKPASDMGPVGLDKCLGFSLHLMELAQSQRTTLASTWTHLLSLRVQLQPLRSSNGVLSAASLRTAHGEALATAAAGWTWLDQFSLLLRCCPQSSDLYEQEFLPGFPSPSSEHLAAAAALVVELRIKVQTARTTLLDIKLDSELPLVSVAEATRLQEVGSQLGEVGERLASLEKVAPVSTLTGLTWLRERMEETACQLQGLTNQTSGGAETAELTEQVELVHTQALLALQRLYQRHVTPHSETEDSNKSEPQVEEEDEEEELEEGHLQAKLVVSLAEDLKELRLPALDASLRDLTTKLALNPAELQLVRGCVPLLDQLMLVAHYLATQLTGALQASEQLLCQLLGLTTMLALKGFNMPAEETEEVEGDGPSQPSQGMGLGEGEGEKDVSDRLESEDQLEGARQEGDEKEAPADKDVKEEEGGVEVSEDFEGKLQDEGKGEGEDEEEEEKEEDDEDTGQEMGETGEDAECLDKQVWGSDSEEEEGEMGEDEKGQGQSQDDVVPEVGAGDDTEEGATEEQQKDKEWDAQQQQEFPEDQKDTQHGKGKVPEEPEPLDLPDDLQLDGGEEDGPAEEEEGENPFDTPELSEVKEMTDVPDTEEPGKEEEEHKGENSGSEDEDGGEGDGKPTEGEEEEGGEEQGQGTAQDEEMPQTSEEQDKDETGAEDHEGMKEHKAEGSAEPAPAQGSADSSAQNDTSAPQKESSSGGEAGEDRGQEGAAQMEEGHASAAQTHSKMAAPSSQPRGGNKQPRERRRPGEADSAHTLGDMQEPVQKRLRLAEGMAEEREEEEGEEASKDQQEKSEGEMHQHVKEAKDNSTQAMDAATQDQARQQQPTVGQEEGGEVPEDDNIDIVEDEPEEPTSSTRKEVRAEPMGAAGREGKGEGDEEGDGEEKVTVEGEVVTTEGAQRGGGCSYHTQSLASMPDQQELSPDQVAALRQELEQQLSTWTQPPASGEARQAWCQFCAATSGLSRDLCEQLRLVLEPTQAARLRGDYRTGRRINMRKVIPYIASEFRKDKIWLRRTRPSKRTYQVVLALDDSSSMADNHSKELAFESLALVSQALTLLEAGELGVMSFGEEPTVLHPLGHTFTEDSGARCLQQLSFSQRHTRLGRLVNFVTAMLGAAARQGSRGSDLAQLLLVVSDGRGVFSEGREAVHQAVRAAREARIFIVFLAIEDPHSKDSILDIRMPVFSGGKLQGISSYLDNFPFPFYLILRDVESLPGVLSDALRQWFELMAAAVQH